MTRSRTSEETELASDALQRLSEEIAVLRQVLDEILDAIEWHNLNRDAGRDDWLPARRITSMPLNIAAPDWSARVNRFSAADLPPESRYHTAGEQSQMF